MEIDLQTKLSSYLSLREALGLPSAYLIPMLHEFVEYLGTTSNDEAIRAQHAIEWACSTNLSASTRKVRLAAARLISKPSQSWLTWDGNT